MGEDEDYGFEYSDEEPEEEDVNIENHAGVRPLDVCARSNREIRSILERAGATFAGRRSI